jgi:hypothetical protein
MDRQIVNGLADQMVLYDYDFLPSPHASRLSVHGRLRLEKYTRMVLKRGIPITIQASPGRPQLDVARRVSVVEELRAIDSSATADWVLVGIPHAKGLRGEEALEIDANNLLNTQQRGGLLPVSSGMSGAGSDQGSGISISPFGE